MTDAERTFFSLKIKDGKPLGNEKIFEYKPYGNVFFIDSPFILDDIDSFRPGFRSFFPMEGTNVYNHQHLLRKKLNIVSSISTYEQMLQDDCYGNILGLFSGAIQGHIQKNERGSFYKDSKGTELKLENLATGSKMLLILKQLLENMQIRNDSLLILDEPEAHLHPEWQNLFAEIIVRLVNDVGCHIVLTTHSINFMLALDAFTKKYDILNRVDFYRTKSASNGFVSYEQMNQSKENIYEDFAMWFSKMKRLHDSFEA